VLVRQGKALLTRDRRVEDGSEIEIVSVVSGG
jgi:sulfur carrier protein ThiS